MFSAGEIVKIYSPTASKCKYHLCVCAINSAGVQHFLFINSNDGYDADFVLQDGEIDCLPASPTGQSVISCSMVVRFNNRQLRLYKATSLGFLKGEIAAKLAEFISASPALPKKQRTEITENMDTFSKGAKK